MRRIFGALIIIIGSMLMLAGTATAHDIVSASAVCTSPNSAEFSFTFANFGSESRFVKVYKGGVLIGDFEAQTGDGVHKYTITNIDTGNGNQANVQFHFESDAVVNMSHDISVDFTACTPSTTLGTTTTSTTACYGDEGCETTTTATTLPTTTTATTLATTTTATTIATTTTAQQTTTTAATTTVPCDVAHNCICLDCTTTTAATSSTTTLGTTTTTAGSTTVASSTTVADTTAADQTVPAPEIEPTMPVTGSETTPMLVFGALLIAAGGGLTLIRKRP